MHCKLHYILVWNILIVSYMYLELNWNISAVSIFFYHWYIMFYAKNYDLVYYNEQQKNLATLQSALIFQYSFNIVQFVVRMRSNKNHKMRHSRKKNYGLEGYSLNPWIFKMFTHNRYCFYFSTEFLQNFLTTLLI